MAQMLWKYTNGFNPKEFSTNLSISDSVALTDDEKDLFVSVVCSAASKTVTLGLEEGQFMVIANVGGSNAVTLKNVSGDTGTSLAAGKVALVIGGSSTADTVKAYVLN